MPTVLAQISDLHLDGSERVSRRATRVLDYLYTAPRPADAILVTGDLTEHATENEYREAARLLSGPVPVLSCPGNHDARPAFREFLLGERAGEGPINQVHRVAGTTIVPADSTVPGRGDGRLDAGRVTTHHRVVL